MKGAAHGAEPAPAPAAAQTLPLQLPLPGGGGVGDATDAGGGTAGRRPTTRPAAPQCGLSPGGRLPAGWASTQVAAAKSTSRADRWVQRAAAVMSGRRVLGFVKRAAEQSNHQPPFRRPPHSSHTFQGLRAARQKSARCLATDPSAASALPAPRSVSSAAAAAAALHRSTAARSAAASCSYPAASSPAAVWRAMRLCSTVGKAAVQPLALRQPLPPDEWQAGTRDEWGLQLHIRKPHLPHTPVLSDLLMSLPPALHCN